MKITIILLLILPFLITSLWCQEPGKDWPQIDGFSERTSASDVSYEPPFEFLKRIIVGGIRDRIESFSYVDGIVYYASPQDENLFGAVDLQSEEVLWTFSLPGSGGGVGMHPAISDSLVYLGGQKARGLYALHRLTGDSIWFQPVGNLFGRDIAIKGDLLYVNTFQGLTCLNKLDGSIQWTFQEWSPQYVCAVDETQVYYFNNDTIYGLDRITGIINWQVPYQLDGDGIIMSIFVDKDQVLVKRSDDLIILKNTDGSILDEFRFKEGTGINWIFGLIAVTADSYLIHSRKDSSSNELTVRRMRKSDGEIIWELDVSESSVGPAVVFGSYFTIINNGDVEIRAIETGEFIQSFSDRLYETGARVKPVDKGLLAASGSFINIFVPKTTQVEALDEDLIQWNILGNPSADHNIQVEIESSHPQRIKYRIVNSMGEEVLTGQGLDLGPGMQTFTIRTNLPGGVYFLNMIHNSLNSTKQFIILE